MDTCVCYIRLTRCTLPFSLNWAVGTGLVEIISAPKEFYSNLSNVRESFGDNEDRVR